MSLLGALEVAEQSSQFDLKPNYGVSVERDITTLSGSGAVNHSGAEFELTTGTTSSSKAQLDSAERGRYLPGTVGVPGIAVRRPSGPKGDQDLKWGYFDANDGFGFGEDIDGLYVFVRKGGSDTIIRRGAWNEDVLNGDGPSRQSLDLSRGNIFRMPYVYYGYGTIEFVVGLTDNLGRFRLVTVHRYAPDGETSTDNPNLPIAAIADNGTSTRNISLFVAGRQYSVLGRYRPNKRITSEHRIELSGITTTWVPLVSFKRKSGFLGVSVKPEGYDVLGGADFLVQVRLNPSLTNASFGSVSNISDAETAVQSDNSATAISGGEVLYASATESSQGNKTSLTQNNNIQTIDIPEQQIVSLAIRTKTSGLGGTQGTAIFRVEEEW